LSTAGSRKQIVEHAQVAVQRGHVQQGHEAVTRCHLNDFEYGA
jgi:hypothetical protein